DPDAVDLHHLAQSQEPRWRGTDGLPYAAHRHCADRARTPGAPPPRFCGVGHGRATPLTHHADRASTMVRPHRLLRSGRARFPAAGGVPPTRGDRAWAARGLRCQPCRLRPDDGPASIATAIALVLGFSAVAALRYVKHPIIATSVNVAGIGYAVPGTVLALGLLSPLVLVDEGINALARAFGEKGVGLVLAGSSAALIIAYV